MEIDESLNVVDKKRSNIAHSSAARNTPKEESTALISAIIRGHAGIVESLLKAGADPEEKSQQHGTCLEAASLKSRSDIVEILLQHGADVNAEGTLYRNALHAASAHARQDTVELLLKNGARPSVRQNVEEKSLNATDKREKLEKTILYYRHKLPKGFLSRDTPPKEECMKPMSDYLKQLEGYPDLEASILRTTKIPKVLKAMLRLGFVRLDEQYHLNTRTHALLITKPISVGMTKRAVHNVASQNQDCWEHSMQTPMHNDEYIKMTPL